RPPPGGSISRRPRPRLPTAALLAYGADGTPPVFPDDPPSPTWWPLEESMVARGSRLPIYTFVSQLTGEHECALLDSEDGSREVPSPEEQVDADVRFLRGLNLQGLQVGGACDAPIWRVMVSPAVAADGKRPRYDEDNLPTPATLIADLKATANFKSAITDMDDDGPLPYLRYRPFADEIHEDDDKQHIFETFDVLSENIALMETEVVDPVISERALEHSVWCIEDTLQNLAQLAALKQYVLKQRVFYTLIHTERVKHGVSGYVSSSHALLLALGVSPVTGNLVGVVAMQLCSGML
ncbi:unnamed protein product, partial [Ectocarpus sp. 12 AP-2014]